MERGFIGDRDVVTTINLFKRFSSYSRCREPGVSRTPPSSAKLRAERFMCEALT